MMGGVDHSEPGRAGTATARRGWVDEATATVRVHDDDPSPPRHRAPDEDALQQGGWGLDLVARLSRTWGFEPADDGKVVWFTLGREDR